MLDPVPRRHAVCSRLFLPRHHRPSPSEDRVGFPRLSRESRLLAGPCFEDADIPLCSGLQVCSPPGRLYRCNYSAGQPGFYVRAYCASLPPHTPDMLTVRIQAIDGAGTYTLPDFQPCRLLTSLHELADIDRGCREKSRTRSFRRANRSTRRSSHWSAPDYWPTMAYSGELNIAFCW